VSGASIHAFDQARDWGPPVFSVDLSPGTYYAVEVAISPDSLVKRTPAEFYASWAHSNLLRTPSFILPAEVWERLKTASRLYYRMRPSSHPTTWEQH